MEDSGEDKTFVRYMRKMDSTSCHGESGISYFMTHDMASVMTAILVMHVVQVKSAVLSKSALLVQCFCKYKLKKNM